MQPAESQHIDEYIDMTDLRVQDVRERKVKNTTQ
jgi:hypothetical protein